MPALHISLDEAEPSPRGGTQDREEGRSAVPLDPETKGYRRYGALESNRSRGWHRKRRSSARRESCISRRGGKSSASMAVCAGSRKYSYRRSRFRSQRLRIPVLSEVLKIRSLKLWYCERRTENSTRRSRLANLSSLPNKRDRKNHATPGERRLREPRLHKALGSQKIPARGAKPVLRPPRWRTAFAYRCRLRWTSRQEATQGMPRVRSS